MRSKLKARFGKIYNCPTLVFIIIQLYFGEVCGPEGVGLLEVSCSQDLVAPCVCSGWSPGLAVTANARPSRDQHRVYLAAIRKVASFLRFSMVQELMKCHD